MLLLLVTIKGRNEYKIFFLIDAIFIDIEQDHKLINPLIFLTNLC